jgi:hypothetical protein
MGNFLVKLGAKYLEWSTIVDAPVTYLLTRDEMREYLRDEYGRSGSRDTEERLARCDQYGTSSLYQTRDSLIANNRAGDGDTSLTLDELIAKYQAPPFRLDTEAFDGLVADAKEALTHMGQQQPEELVHEGPRAFAAAKRKP